MSSVIIYKSRYGVTRQYAEWIAEETGFELKDPERDEIELDQYDRIIAGASIRAGRMINSKWLYKYRDELADKELIIFSVGGYPPSAIEKIELAKKSSIPSGLTFKHFHLQGKINMSMLRWWEKIIFRILSKFAGNNDEIGMIVKGFDFVKRENIEPIVESLKSSDF